MYKEIQHQYK